VKDLNSCSLSFLRFLSQSYLRWWLQIVWPNLLMRIGIFGFRSICQNFQSVSEIWIMIRRDTVYSGLEVWREISSRGRRIWNIAEFGTVCLSKKRGYTESSRERLAIFLSGKNHS
jgi:hypothetical protein